MLTSTTYHGGVKVHVLIILDRKGSLSSSLALKVAGFPYTKVAAVPAVSYAAAYPYAHASVYYGKREAEVITNDLKILASLIGSMKQ